MASATQLPCDPSGVCMRCKVTPTTEESLLCSTCDTPWHVACLSSESLVCSGVWKCPDCSDVVDPAPVSGIGGIESAESSLVAEIRAIEADESLSEGEKAKRRQKLLSGDGGVEEDDEKNNKGKKKEDDGESEFECATCKNLLDRPVTLSCGHNFCLKCFQKWLAENNLTCMTCRCKIPKKMAANPRINLTLVTAIRLASQSTRAAVAPGKVNHVIRNQDRPDKAFTTDRAVKAGLANASSGKIYVTIPGDHFGPIPPEHDPTRNQGLSVGDFWPDRQGCRQWGAHFPHVSGIAGQSTYGAQSVVLSGGYLEDEDHGEWFLYTGSGGRDLSGNKRTNKKHSFDQTFTKLNEALRVSCKMGYPVRVVRSHKEKRSAYAPVEKSVRYDGVYRIEKCWRKAGMEAHFLVCRYLFVRCDNGAAPWASDGLGDRPRPLPDIPELENAIDLFERQESPSWDFDEAEGRWKWMKPPPASRKSVVASSSKKRKNTRNTKTMRDKLLKEFGCQICRKVMSHPVTTPCAHNFCKECLEAKFSGVTRVRERSRGGRTLRSQKNVMICPCCPTDLSEYLQNPQVNRELMDVIEKLTKKEEESEESSEIATASSSGGNTGSEEEEEEEEEEEAEEEEEEEEDEEGEETEMVEAGAEEPPSKRMKLDTDTVAAAPSATV